MAAPILADLGRVSSWITDHQVAAPPRPADMAHLPSALNSVLAGELAGAQEILSASAEEILLAALGRAIARTVGDGMLSVDVDAESCTGRIALRCAPSQEVSALDMLDATRNAVRTATAAADAPSDIRFTYRSGSEQPPASTALLALYAHLDADAGVVILNWSYDARSFDPYTIEELAEQFPQALVEVTAEG
ncbi:MAG: polyketide synthase [Mycobacterium sp.]|nr:polyketide synthase [Mycobacterium sp.]